MIIDWHELNYVKPLLSEPVDGSVEEIFEMVLAYHRQFNKVFFLSPKEVIDVTNLFDSASDVKWTYFTFEKYNSLVADGLIEGVK